MYALAPRATDRRCELSLLKQMTKANVIVQ